MVRQEMAAGLSVSGQAAEKGSEKVSGKIEEN